MALIGRSVEEAEKEMAKNIEPTIVTVELKKAAIVGLSADAIESAFAPMVIKLREIEKEFDGIVTRDINEETIEMARELRKKMVKLRTGTDKIHEEQKKEFLIKGRAVDSVKNVLHAAVFDKEKKLSEIENYFINIEKEARIKLFNERLALLEPLVGAEAKLMALADMSQPVFDSILENYQIADKAKKEKAIQDENDRIEAQRKKEEEDKRIREENAQLNRLRDRIRCLTQIGAIELTEIVELHDKKTGYNKFATIDNLKIWSDEKFEECLTSFHVTKINNQEVDKNEKEAADLKQKAIEDKLKKERLERKRLEDEAAEKNAKEEAERKANIAAERKAKRAPDKIKLLTLAEQIELLECLPLKDEEAQVILSNATDLLAKVVKYIKTNADKL